MKNILFILFLITTIFAQAQEYTTYLPDHPNIQYEGRIDFSNPVQPAFAFSGISIKAKFNGTAVKVSLKGYAGDGLNYFNVFIDGVWLKKFALGEETINEVCQTDLSAGIHTLEITKRTESFLGKVEFLGFDIDGELLVPAAKPVQKIQFIGNSITCGYGNEDVSTNGFDPALENNYLAYGAICARELNTQYQAISYSGRGAIFNWACSEGDVVPAIYEKYFADEELSESNQYDHTLYVPDVIVINLGTNDHSCDQLTDENFKTAYVNFITQLKIYYPTVKIVCLTGPMNSSSVFQVRLEDIVSTAGGEGNGIYTFFQTPTINADYAGGHWHPNTLMADINGKEVAAFIQENNLLSITKTNTVVIEKPYKIFPNPAKSGELHIEVSKMQGQDSIMLKLANAKGETVLTKQLSAGKVHTIPVKSGAGIYFLLLKRGEKVYTEKIIMQ